MASITFAEENSWQHMAGQPGVGRAGTKPGSHMGCYAQYSPVFVHAHALEDFHLADGRPDHSLRRVPLDINVPRRRSVHTYRLVADIRLMDSRQRA